MNLATRCNACDTVFRVVRDQLRISDGWVRCGRCMAVFNATDDLFELEADAGEAAALGETARRVLDELDADRRQAGAATTATAWTPPARAAEGLHDEVAAHPASMVSTPAVWQGPEPDDGGLATIDEPDAADTVPADTVPADDGRPAVVVEWDTTPAEPEADSAPPPVPSFVRRAERAAFWRRPRMRLALGALAALLAATLVLQAGHAGRDQIAAQWPALQPALEALCNATGCRVAPLRRIDRLVVASAGLTLQEGASIYRLQVVLHNRAETAVLAPALELTLNDAQGVLVARRVLQGAELGLASPAVAAGAQLPLVVSLAADDRRIAGYQVELFYP